MHGDNIYFEVFGEQSDPALILIAGLGGQLNSWPRDFINYLVNHKYYVIAVDNRDSGLSKKYDELGTFNVLDVMTKINNGEHFKPPYTLDDMAFDIYELMSKLQIIKSHFVGISMGGNIAQVFSINYPEACLSMTCIGATSGDPDLPPPKQDVLDYFFSKNRRVNNLEEYIEDRLSIYKIYNTTKHINEEQMRKHYVETYKRSFEPDGISRQMLAMICAQPRTEQLKNVFNPSLIVHGTHDPVFPLEHGKHLANCLPNSKLKIIENLGHGFPECLWEEMANMIAKFNE